jgi:hypothetical protein
MIKKGTALSFPDMEAGNVSTVPAGVRGNVLAYPDMEAGDISMAPC